VARPLADHHALSLVTRVTSPDFLTHATCAAAPAALSDNHFTSSVQCPSGDRYLAMQFAAALSQQPAPTMILGRWCAKSGPFDPRSWKAPVPAPPGRAYIGMKLGIPDRMARSGWLGPRGGVRLVARQHHEHRPD